MRPRSITGPIILVVIGVVFLLNNIWRDIPIWTLVSDYWPVLLIVLGVIGLIEVFVHAARGEGPPPRPAAAVGGWFWIFIIIMLVFWSGHRSGIHIGRLDNGGVTILGNDYEYDVNASSPSQGVTRVVLDNVRGNLSVKGEDSGDIKVSGRKTIRAFNKRDADRGNEQSQVKVDRQGDLLIIRSQEPSGIRMLNISADLDITVPKGIDVEARGRNGDLTVEDINGAIDVTNGRGDVRLNNIGKDIHIDSQRTGLIRTTGVKGNVDIQGRGGEVQIENVQGQVTINGEYSGTLEFKAIEKPFHFRSAHSDFSVQRIPGAITLDLSELKINDAVGPLRFQTGSRDIEANDVTNGLELTVDRGDIHVNQTKTPLPKMDVRARNGDVTLTVPASAAFDLDARSNQGEAQNDFGSPIESRSEGRSSTLKGRVGSGGPSLVVQTDRGTVTLRKN